ncbi:hypothetical protein SBRCBS47491_000429 [Sporothrix bragantina]|uniref:Cytochrome P450 n=1 Tax=Sporothrix bragantina TaxID=671064 RepID=A0ABP0AQ89_9PEZI
MTTLVVQTRLSLTSAVAIAVGIAVVVYVVYQRWFHPLAKYPGPFWASITDVWQVREFLSLRQPYRLTDLHEKYNSPFVRYGPDKISITTEDAIPLLFQKGGRHYPKTEFYDAYGAKTPNVFGMRDVGMHSLRRRHMSHSFSLSYVKDMEEHLDLNIRILRDTITELADSGKAFNLKTVLHHYVIDVLGELAFSQSFGIQKLARIDAKAAAAKIPPVAEHSLLAAATGAWPAMTRTLKQWLPLVPHNGLRELFEGRNKCANLAAECVQRRIGELEGTKDGASQRKDILTNLILATHPETGERLTQADLEAEAFGFIIAGTHTTSATTSLLLYHLLHYPETMRKVVAELDEKLPPLDKKVDGEKEGQVTDAGRAAYSVTEAEAFLPYLKLCVRENFRLTPVFTMPLARRVMAPEGVVVGGQHFPQGTSLAVCNHAFHHNPEIWGPDHNVFDPSRWEDRADTAGRARYLMHFGLGSRQCIGKTVAQTNIMKLASTLLREFEFELADAEERAAIGRGDYYGKIPDMCDSERPSCGRCTQHSIGCIYTPRSLRDKRLGRHEERRARLARIAAMPELQGVPKDDGSPTLTKSNSSLTAPSTVQPISAMREARSTENASMAQAQMQLMASTILT